MKEAMISCFRANCLTEVLNKCARSASSNASVYSKAASNTPGPMSMCQSIEHRRRKVAIYQFQCARLRWESQTSCIGQIYHQRTLDAVLDGGVNTQTCPLSKELIQHPSFRPKSLEFLQSLLAKILTSCNDNTYL